MLFKVYEIFILVCFLFFFGAFTGWFLELLFRRFISTANPQRLWLNPGFLTGPYLPLYGFGVVFLYLISLFEEHLAKFDNGGIVHWVIMFFLMSITMTIIEYIAGIIFIKGMKIKLWDYTDEKFNIKGIVCLKFSLIWGALSLLYYFFIYPHLAKMVHWVIEHPLFSFVIGIVFGIFIVDVVISMNVGAAIKKKAKELDAKTAIDFKKLQEFTKGKFFSISRRRSFADRIESFQDFVKRSPDSISNS